MVLPILQTALQSIHPSSTLFIFLSLDKLQQLNQCFIWGLLTWRNEDDWMNMTEICECNQKLTITNFVNLTESFNKICHNDKHCLLKMTENQNFYKYHHNGKHELVNIIVKKIEQFYTWQVIHKTEYLGVSNTVIAGWGIATMDKIYDFQTINITTISILNMVLTSLVLSIKFY